MKSCIKTIKYQKAEGLLSRLKGLIGKENFAPFLITGCRAVHTFGMKVDLDLLWLDKDYRVVKVHKNVGRGKMKFCKKAQHVLECKSGFAKKEGIEVGDNLKEVLYENSQKSFLKNEEGQALVEAAFVLPILIMIVFGFVQLGLAIHELQKLTYVTNYATQTGSLTNDTLKITGAVQEYYTASEVTINVESLDGTTQNIKNNNDRRYKDILKVQLKKPFNISIPFMTVSVLNLKTQASARVLCSNSNPPYTCL